MTRGQRFPGVIVPRWRVSCPDWSGTYTTKARAQAAVKRFNCHHRHVIVEVVTK